MFRDRACITNAFVVRYFLRIGNIDSDISYNIGWVGLWTVAEIALGLCVICMLAIPKFISSRRHCLPSRVPTLWTSNSVPRGREISDDNNHTHRPWRRERRSDSHTRGMIGRRGDTNTRHLQSRGASKDTLQERETRRDVNGVDLNIAGKIHIHRTLSDVELQNLRS